MTSNGPTAAGWYADESTGGTRYWDGRRWTGDTRPRRQPFAAASAHRGWGLGLMIFGVLGLFSVGQSGVSAIPIGLAAIAVGLYLFRGQGPSTKSVAARAQSDRLSDAVRTSARPRATPGATPSITINVGGASAPETQAAAQVKALADPETAKALLNLQNLLYTHTITDAEFEAAKKKLLGDVT